MNWRKLTEPPWRTIVAGLLIVVLVPSTYLLWTPGKSVRDGRHDLGRNGIWMGHGWLGADEWFIENNKTNELERFRQQENLEQLAHRLRRHNIYDLYPHLCPATMEGALPAVDHNQAEKFLDVFGANFRVMPWIGGVNGVGARYEHERWRERFIGEVADLLQRHPRFAGIHLNVEPLTSGDQAFLRFLDQLRAALPNGKILSIAAYPPPTRWHPFPEVHWDEAYFREVAKRSDQLAVMMYDTSLRLPKVYENLMADWTREVLAWSEGKPVLLGLPSYADADTGYHRPDVENLKHGLRGIHAGLAGQPLPSNYQGVAIYCEWETDNAEWEYLSQHFSQPKTGNRE